MRRTPLIVKLGHAAVAIPAVGFVIGMLLQLVIPGCSCNEGSGCHGCGPLNEIVGFLLFGGFVGALCAAMFVVPACYLVAWLFPFADDHD